MSKTTKGGLSRRELMKKPARSPRPRRWPASPSRTSTPPQNNTIQVALVGCGGRGTGAAGNALSHQERPDQARRHGRRLPGPARRQLQRPAASSYAEQVDVPDDRKFIGFDGYKKAMDCLQAGRRRHPRHAAGLPLGALRLRHREGPQRLHGEAGHGRRPEHAARCSSSAEEAEKKNLKVGVGLMCRHCDAREELFDRIKDGEIGDIILLRAYRMAGPIGSAFAGPSRTDISELMYQIQQLPRLPVGQRRLLTATSSSTTSTNAAG